MHLKFFILSLRNNTNSEITNFCLEKKNQPLSFRLKQSLLRFHVPNRKNFLRSTKPMKTKIYKPNWGYWRVSLSSVLSSFLLIVFSNAIRLSVHSLIASASTIRKIFSETHPLHPPTVLSGDTPCSTADDTRRANS